MIPLLHPLSTDLLRPVVCDSLIRLGDAYDGGYVVPREALERAALLLSFGLATNWSFERDAAALNPQLRIEVYDHSVSRTTFLSLGLRAGLSVPLRLITFDVRGSRASARKFARAVEYFRFFRARVRHHRQRVWYNRDAGSASIADILGALKKVEPLSVFAKIDIELSEYRVMPAIHAYAWMFSGLVIEFHHTDICADVFNRGMSALRECFEVVHVHGNNHGDLNIDHTLPLSLEVTLLNKQMFTAQPEPYTGPLPRPELDSPNDHRRADYSLRLA